MDTIIPIKFLDLTSPPSSAGTQKVNYKQLAARIIGEIPAENILNNEEFDLYKKEKSIHFSPEKISATKLVVVIKATRLCNLRCTYCHSWAEGKGNTLTFFNLMRSLHRFLSIPNIKRFEFVWHGGEVTLLNVSYFKKLIWLQQQFKKPGQIITNTVQTNAVNIPEDWLLFLKGIGMSVGISVDGIPEIHDSRRLDYRGRPTSQRVAAGMKKLRQYGIPYGALIVVDRDVYESNIEKMLSYFHEIDLTDIEFLNIVPDNRLKPGDDPGGSYINYHDYINFLSKVFRIWWGNYRDKINIRLFDGFINSIKYSQKKISDCYWAGNCSQEIITLEPNGTISACDKYVGAKGNNYGSIIDNDLGYLLKNSNTNKNHLIEEKESYEKMHQCKWFFICNGGCPHDRVINRKHNPNYNNSCCGTGNLLKTIEQVMAG
ncbi:darobactin maturation radical SAM/SPASM protein DarE [Xenorhabdus griffiniae]|uniref:darobactin maturation radical SAM/SPASM protein DarE n=1 Tax=Xenorhabdus griffiniae TaxID=351672 RepID=UPI00235872F8|nr:darobactin maturation radical SAM/SPASM protein DarE [Xenorhabdus griffiniae]MDC9605042.1 darobactin maturation radical SAM/SPASM protein DarE [Xenorhabdus griffiniae]